MCKGVWYFWYWYLLLSVFFINIHIFWFYFWLVDFPKSILPIIGWLVKNNLFNYSSLLLTFINAITLSAISWHLHNHFVFSGCGLVSARRCRDLLRGTLDALCAWHLAVSWEPIVVTPPLTTSEHILINICTRVLELLICGARVKSVTEEYIPGGTI